jgi:hypothetical protein
MPKSLQKGLATPERLVPLRPAGISATSTAPFWRGARCEDVVQKRTAARVSAQAERKASGKPAKPRTPAQQLARLRRALPKRKTLAARERIAAQIKALEAAG